MQTLKFTVVLFSILISTIFCGAQDITLTSQEDVDAFDPSTTSISGNLTIRENSSGSNITDLSNLSNLTSVADSLWITFNDSLTNVDGLSNLTSIGGYLNISFNDALTNIDGLSNVNSVGEHLFIWSNNALTNVDGLSGITTINSYVFINENAALTNIDGLSNLNYIGGYLQISSCNALTNIDGLSNLNYVGAAVDVIYNDALTNIDGLSSLTYIGGYLAITVNPLLTNIDGLNNVSFIGEYMEISYNDILSDCCGIQNLLLTPNAVTDQILITDNLMPCNNQNEILQEDCGNNINIIEGNVFLDNDGNCLFDQGDIPYESIIVQAESPEYTYTTVTDYLGDYKFYLDTGSYIVQAYMANPYTQACTPSFTADILDDTASDTFNFKFPATINTFCPYLEVDISTWALRECFDNTYSVQYCNSGTVDATNAYIELELDTYLSIFDASIPFNAPDSNNIYTFDIGTVGIGDCGSFNVNIHLPCDTLNTGQFLGQTLCVNAHIYPDSICLPPSNIWDGSSVQVTGTCEQDSVVFRIKNVGSGDMLSDKTLYVLEDQVIFMTSPFQLDIGEEIELAYFANGSTFRLDAEQSDGHPGNSNPSVAIESCGTGPIFSLGFINQFSQDDSDVFISNECREVTGSYDPNDKQAFPAGYGEEHFIEKNTDIEYLIRFQNTGTDTAFTVVIQDEISPLLDITTIQPGASSHPYTFEIDTVVRFIFNDILLVDSFTNEAASHGFVKFRIAQQADLPNGTLLENTAEIYFDFNAPIITNTTFHTIGEEFVTIDLISNVKDLFQLTSAKAYPSPFSSIINFELDGVFQEINLTVYDVRGRVVAVQSYSSSQFQFNRGNLNSGVYFYQLSSEGLDIASGKMIIE